MRKILCAAVLAACFSSPAFANFSGGRIEGRVGWDRPGLEIDFDDGEDQFSFSDSDDGLLYGVEAGYDFQMSEHVVLGIYGGFDMSDTKRCGPLFGNDEACLKVRRNLTDAVMVYAKGGYSNGRIKATYEDFGDPTNNDSASESRGGIHVGAGLELALGTMAYAKIEYVYTDYKSFLLDDFTKGDFDRSQVIGGIGIRFR
jgi:outer membrane immunogenic protein